MTEPGRRVGRPRSAAADRAILDAALDELVLRGIDGFSVEAVASRAGVGKSTIYRRWSNASELILEVVSRADEAARPTLAGASVRDDLVATLEAIARHHRLSAHGRLLPRVLASAATHPELVAAYRARVIGKRREFLWAVLERGIATGELRADLDLEVALRVLVYPMIFTLMDDDGDLPHDLAPRLVDAALEGLAPR